MINTVAGIIMRGSGHTISLDECCTVARAVIEAMNNPTWLMQEAGKNASWYMVDGSSEQGGPRGWQLEFDKIDKIWRAMIEAALIPNDTAPHEREGK